MRIATKYIGINLFNAYYTKSKSYQPVLNLVTDKGKVLGTKLRKIVLHLQPFHQIGGKNLLLLFHHHDHVIEYLLFQ